MQFKKREPIQSEGSSKFLKIADGESVKGVCRGDIHEHYIRWEGGRGIPTSDDDPEAKLRFRLNFIVHDGSKFVAKIWEFGLTVYNQLAEVNDEYPLEQTKIKVSRRGTGKDTTYNVLPVAKEPIGPATLKEIQAVPLNILEPKPRPQSSDEEEMGF